LLQKDQNFVTKEIVAKKLQFKTFPVEKERKKNKKRFLLLLILDKIMTTRLRARQNDNGNVEAFCEEKPKGHSPPNFKILK
jgi:hypothetical protein